MSLYVSFLINGRSGIKEMGGHFQNDQNEGNPLINGQLEAISWCGIDILMPNDSTNHTYSRIIMQSALLIRHPRKRRKFRDPFLFLF